MTTLLTIFRRFPTTFRRYPKIFQNCSEGQTIVPENFPKNSEDCRRLLKTSKKVTKISRSHTNEFKYNLRENLDISETIEIFTSEDMEDTPLESWMYSEFRMNLTSRVFCSKTLVLYNKHFISLILPLTLSLHSVVSIF